MQQLTVHSLSAVVVLIEMGHFMDFVTEFKR